MPITEHTGTHAQAKFHEYSWLHKLCFTSANSRQTFSHEAESLSLPPSLSLLSLALSPPINPVHSASPSGSSPSPLFTSPTLPLCIFPFHFPVIFRHHPSAHPALGTISSSPRILGHTASFDDYSYHSQTTSTCLTSLSLNYPPLISAARGVVCSHSDWLITPRVTLCMLWRGLTLLIPSMNELSLSGCRCVINLFFLVYLYTPPPHNPLSSFEKLLYLLILTAHPKTLRLKVSQSSVHTREGDVEALQWYGEVRNEA